jgi:hypothetical protein
MFRGNLMISAAIAWFQPMTIFMMFTAMAPLIGVALGRALSSSKLRRQRNV